MSTYALSLAVFDVERNCVFSTVCVRASSPREALELARRLVRQAYVNVVDVRCMRCEVVLDCETE